VEIGIAVVSGHIPVASVFQLVTLANYYYGIVPRITHLSYVAVVGSLFLTTTNGRITDASPSLVAGSHLSRIVDRASTSFSPLPVSDRSIDVFYVLLIRRSELT
jgi:hypothetical protein